MFDRYSEYKNSGVEWIGEVPKNWSIASTKHLLQIPITDGPHTTPELIDDGIPFVSAEAIKNGEIDFNKKRGNISIKDHQLFSQKYLPKRGDIFMVKSGATTGNVAIVKTNDEFSIWSPLAVFRADGQKMLPEYLHFFLQSYSFRKGVELNWSFGTQQNIGMGVLSCLPIAYGSLAEQAAIANFLIGKTAQLDQAISIKEKQIELLKERRQILIHNSVTRGLDPDVKMKDSGVEWIGEIPEHWEVRRLKTFIKDLESGVSVNASESENAEINEIGVLKTSCVYNYIFEHFENKKVFESDLRRVSCPVKANTIIISRMNAPELVGASGYVSSEYPNLFLPDRLWQTVFHENCALNVLWLSKVFTVKGFRNCITAIANGSSPSMKNISKGDYLNLRVATPPVEEQDALVEYIEGLSQKIATAISLKQKEIEKLKEYKSTLINSAVTGKIKVS